MTERERVCVVTTMGAIAGAVVSYLLFTERGSALRRQIVPAFEDLERELNHFKATIAKSAGIANDGWKLLSEMIGETSPPRRSMTNPHQTVPF